MPNVNFHGEQSKTSASAPCIVVSETSSAAVCLSRDNTPWGTTWHQFHHYHDSWYDCTVHQLHLQGKHNLHVYYSQRILIRTTRPERTDEMSLHNGRMVQLVGRRNCIATQPPPPPPCLLQSIHSAAANHLSFATNNYTLSLSLRLLSWRLLELHKQVVFSCAAGH